MVQNALDTLENKERKIVYSTPKEFDTSLLKETWLIRSDVLRELLSYSKERSKLLLD